MRGISPPRLVIVLPVRIEQERPPVLARPPCLLPLGLDVAAHGPPLGRERLFVVEVEVEREAVHGGEVDGRRAGKDRAT